MIKIRYADLPAGLHVRAEARGRTTIIYLLPGLRPTERRAALLRARRSASLGYGPRLPATGVAVAVTVDQIKATLRNGVVAFRAHPLLLFPPVIIAATATMVYIMLVSGTLTIREPQASAPFPQPGAALGAPRSSQSGLPGDRPGAVVGRFGAGPASDPRPGQPDRSPRRSRSPSPLPSRSSSPSSQPTGVPSFPPQPPSPSASPSPSPSPSMSCLKISFLGLCLTV